MASSTRPEEKTEAEFSSVTGSVLSYLSPASSVAQETLAKMVGRGRSGSGSGSSVANEFIPGHRREQDLLFTSLRRVIFQIDRRSATAIAHTIRDELRDAQIYELMDDYRASENDRDKKKIVRRTKLEAKMDEARAKHALKLRNLGMRDVNVMYHGDEAKLCIFKADKELLGLRGGKLYHLWPMDHVKRSMGMCIIVKPETLEELYPAGRLNIVITVNTAPADVSNSSHVEGPAYRPGSIFPNLASRISLSPTVGGVEWKQAIDRAVDDICSERPSSGSLPGPNSTEQSPWNCYGSSLRSSQPQRLCSSKSTSLSTYDFVDNNAWWLNDLKLRRGAVSEWNERTKKTIKVVADQLDDDPNNTSQDGDVASSGQGIIPGLCDTHVDDRNYEWHREHVEAAEVKETTQRLKVMESRFAKGITTAKRLVEHFDLLEDQVRRYPQDVRARQNFKTVNHSIEMAKEDLYDTREAVFQLRKAFGHDGVGLFKGLDLDFILDESSGPSFQRRAMKPHRVLNREKTVADPVGLAEPGHTPLPQAVAPLKIAYRDFAYDPKTNRAAALAPPPQDLQAVDLESEAFTDREGTIPFPAYQDPMAGQAPVVEGGIVRTENTTPKVRRTIASRNLVAILAATGVPERQSKAQIVPSEELFDRIPSPITPLDWPRSARRANERDRSKIEDTSDLVAVKEAPIMGETTEVEEAMAA